MVLVSSVCFMQGGFGGRNSHYDSQPRPPLARKVRFDRRSRKTRWASVSRPHVFTRRPEEPLSAGKCSFELSSSADSHQAHRRWNKWWTTTVTWYILIPLGFCQRPWSHCNAGICHKICNFLRLINSFTATSSPTSLPPSGVPNKDVAVVQRRVSIPASAPITHSN